MHRKKLGRASTAILLLSALLLVTNITLGATLIFRAHNTMMGQVSEHMLDVANSAATQIDGDVLKDLTPADKGSADYEKLTATLASFQQSVGLKSVYVVRKAADGAYKMVFDPTPDNAAPYGYQIPDTSALHDAGRGTPAVVSEPYHSPYGFFYSAYSPVFDSDGKVAGLVCVDFDAEPVEDLTDDNTRTIIIICGVSAAAAIVVMFLVARGADRQIQEMTDDLVGLSEDLDELVGELTQESGKGRETSDSSNNIEDVASHITELREALHDYVAHDTRQANAMITAMASDYRAVYYVDLDSDEGICFRTDPGDQKQTPEGEHFTYLERFTWYGKHYVSEEYREDFLRFIDPVNVRAALAERPLIAYRYLARRDGREYYEMIRMAGVRRIEERERDDGVVHAIGLGLTEIDDEMRETLARNQALTEALVAAEEANVAKTAFLSSMSHEIRTPMNAIIGLDTLALNDDTISDETRTYLEKIGNSAQHLLGLINDILDMSRIESGRLALQREEFSFQSMLEQINTMVESQCADKGLDFECRMLSAVDDAYIGDDMKLKQVLVNMLSNAIKFTDAPGKVTLSVERIARYHGQSTLRFKVSDTGIGMDPEFIPKIFDSFAQEDTSRRSKYGSTGLGMAIAKNIVEMMNGTIEVESEKGVGSTFTVVVTLTDAVSSARDLTIDISDLRVLVVDDDEVSAEHARMVLGEAGIHTDTALSAMAALEALDVAHAKMEPYHLVLMDWKMPDIDGIEATRLVREHYGTETTVVILTAYNWDNVAEQATEVGVDGFLAKPLFASNVVDEFERIARRSQLKKAQEKGRAELEGRLILLAEDIEMNAEIMMDILEMREIECDHAENGRICVDMFAASEPGTYSAILMDVRMPEMDGLEATATIRALDHPDARTIPIIALTANAFDEDVQRSLQAGMNAHLNKPVEHEVLYETLEELIYEAEHLT